MQQTELNWEERRDQGIVSSAEHAEADVPGWGQRAVELLAMRIMFNSNPSPFTMEEFRNWTERTGSLPIPPDARAWGSVTQKAIRQGIIRKTGQYAPAASSNGSPKPLYVGT